VSLGGRLDLRQLLIVEKDLQALCHAMSIGDSYTCVKERGHRGVRGRDGAAAPYGIATKELGRAGMLDERPGSVSAGRHLVAEGIGVLEAALDGVHEARAHLAIDDAMVGGQRDAHHLAHRDAVA